MRLSNREKNKLSSLATTAVRTMIPDVTCDKVFHVANGLFIFVFNVPNKSEKLVLTSEDIRSEEYFSYCVKRKIKCMVARSYSHKKVYEL